MKTRTIVVVLEKGEPGKPAKRSVETQAGFVETEQDVLDLIQEIGIGSAPDEKHVYGSGVLALINGQLDLDARSAARTNASGGGKKLNRMKVLNYLISGQDPDALKDYQVTMSKLNPKAVDAWVDGYWVGNETEIETWFAAQAK
jgi:hypothetical protein